ncbi:N-acetylmuramoyl-L-alanine amidase [Paracidovorax konjaci]|uniref:N-acetylmuramoyl-L-alanine amidase n=1 Tax=Paracidovorax konjaci TaxID=32040 RepID=A0A1I1U3V6_9BURK|nr:N-acetylmuramoyl-L-alanine amidase [Paracidovorax konjaci]SFD65526.1 N-acetylmuramoyl-L-alanine amidase [Paracidovorax konjaci]
MFQSYGRANANGAHFLVAKGGVIYQTASVFRTTRHVGKIKARCLAEHRCTPAEMAQYGKFSPDTTNRLEMSKSVPQRYPSNFDSIGVELVGRCRLPAHIKMPVNLTDIQKNVFMEKFGVYDAVTSAQQSSLQFLLRGLLDTLRIPLKEVHRHPEVSYKQKTEASTAAW